MSAAQWLAKASRAIKKRLPIAYDVAGEHGQDLENVADMLWFISEVADRIKADERSKFVSRAKSQVPNVLLSETPEVRRMAFRVIVGGAA